MLKEYATLLGFYLASVAVLTGISIQQNRLPTHKLSRIVARDRITWILRENVGAL